MHLWKSVCSTTLFSAKWSGFRCMQEGHMNGDLSFWFWYLEAPLLPKPCTAGSRHLLQLEPFIIIVLEPVSCKQSGKVCRPKHPSLLIRLRDDQDKEVQTNLHCAVCWQGYRLAKLPVCASVCFVACWSYWLNEAVHTKTVHTKTLLTVSTMLTGHISILVFDKTRSQMKSLDSMSMLFESCFICLLHIYGILAKA